MGDIKQETMTAVMPQTLRAKYGDSLGADVWKVLQVVDRKEDALHSVLTALDNLATDDQRRELIYTIWQRYYQKIAFEAIGIN